MRVRLIGGFLLMALISASIGIIGNSNLRSMRQADLDLYHYDTEPQPYLAHISVTFQKIRVALRDFLASPTADERTKFLNQANDLGRDLDGAIERSGAKYLSHEERGLFDQFIQARGAYRSFETQILAAGNSGRPQDGWTILWSDGYGNVAKTVLGAIAGIEQMKVADARKASATNLARANLASAEMLIAITLGLLVALGGGAWLTISITRPLNEAVLNLTSASQQILATTTTQATGAREQAAAVSQTATTADQITQTAQQAAERARNMGDNALRTAEIGGAGKKAVDGSIAAMHVVREQIESTAQNILALAEQAQAIGEIIATVNDIAEQTNLLALNAAIEASRAGEQGKGFAVVAGEVKELASQSKQATVQVRQILGEIQKATNAAVLSTEAVTRGMSEVNQVSGQAGETIGTLAETLAETVQAAAQIAASAGQQAIGMAQIALAIKDIDQVTKQTLAATHQSEQAAVNLNLIGKQLAMLVG